MEKAVMPADRIKHWQIVRGDKVVITAGIDKGQRGTVLEVHRKFNTMLISGCRLNKKRAHGPNGEKTYLYELESPVHYAHVHLVDPSDDKACAIEYKYDESGKAVRVSMRTQTEIPKPKMGRRDFNDRWKDYKEGPKDTQNAELLLRTYFPTEVKTFAEKIKEQLPEQEQFNYPPKNLPFMKRDRKSYPKLKKRMTHSEWFKYAEWQNMDNFEKQFEDTIEGIETLKTKNLDEYEQSLLRDAEVAKSTGVPPVNTD